MRRPPSSKTSSRSVGAITKPGSTETSPAMRFAEGATLMGAFGGSGHTKPMTEEQQRIFGALWQSGTGDVELIDGGVSEDIAWLVMVERASVRFRDRNETERWDLRVTELFRRNGDVWERFHRHADPLVEVHDLDDIRRLLG